MASFLNRFWAPKRVSPSSFEGDNVVRAYAGDDLKVYRQIMAWTLQFDDVLDADVIKSSISQLLEIGAWRKLGGRLRLSVCPRLLVHAAFHGVPADSGKCRKMGSLRSMCQPSSHPRDPHSDFRTITRSI